MNLTATQGLDLDSFRDEGTEKKESETSFATAERGALDRVVDRERTARKIMADLDDLPSLPNVISEVMRMANDPATNASDFDTIVRNDQALAAKVLRLVNSSFFALPNPVNNISQAIVILGFRTLKSVVLAASTSRLLDGPLSIYGLEPGGLWKHSICAASAARLIARKAGFSPEEEEELFVAGLLHDVGKIILIRHISGMETIFRDALVHSGGDPVPAEEELFGISHPEVGRLMASRWNLSPELGGLIGGHHERSNSMDDRHLAVVRMADTCCNLIGIGRTGRPAEAFDMTAAFSEVAAPLDLVDAEAEILADLDEVLADLGEIIHSVAS